MLTPLDLEGHILLVFLKAFGAVAKTKKLQTKKHYTVNIGKSKQRTTYADDGTIHQSVSQVCQRDLQTLSFWRPLDFGGFSKSTMFAQINTKYATVVSRSG